jgi:lysophospholipase L1-like esterase
LKHENKTLRDKLTSKQSQKEDTDAIKNDVSELKEQMSDFLVTLELLKKQTENLPSKTDMYFLQSEVKNFRKEQAAETIQQTDKLIQTIETTQAVATTKESSENSKIQSLAISTENKPSNSHRHSNTHHDTKQVLILGDSVTRGLRKDKMTTNSTTVQIKSHRGATVKKIHTAITDSETQPKTIKEADIIIIHAGINNISNADKPKDICEDYQKLTDTLQGINSKAKIMISSIVPKKRDLLSTENISATNNLLRSKCSEKGFTFIDNNSVILKNGKVDHTLFYDEVHLNNEGSALLGKQLKSAIRTILGIQQNTTSQSVNFRKAQHHPTHEPNRRYIPRNRGYTAPHRHRPPNPWMSPKW